MTEAQFEKSVDTVWQQGMRAALASQREVAFRAMVRAHDLTYIYSNGADYWRGLGELRAIVVAAEQLPRERACEIWNRVVDEKIVPRSRADWYWSVEKEIA